MIIAVTGHRPDKLYGYNLSDSKYSDLKNRIKKEIVKILNSSVSNYTAEGISGMALGVDMVFAKAIIELQQLEGYGIRLCCALPCLNQTAKWKEDQKKAYNDILQIADEVVYVSKELYSEGCMQARNQYMINRCDVLIAVYNGDQTGGTYDAIVRARNAGKDIVYIHPNKLEV